MKRIDYEKALKERRVMNLEFIQGILWDTNMLSKLFSRLPKGTSVVHLGHDYATGMNVISLVSDKFAPTQEGLRIPRLRARITEDEDGNITDIRLLDENYNQLEF